MSKQILIDGTALVRTRTGVAQYIINLFSELAKLDPATDYSFYIMKLGRLAQDPITAPNVHYRYIPLPIKLYSLLHRVGRLPIPVDLLARIRPDLAIFPNFVRFPLASKVKSIIVVHDLTYLIYPQYCPERNRKFLTNFMPGSMARSARIVAVSENTKRDIIKYYKVRPEKVVVVPNAVDETLYTPQPKTAVTALSQRLGLPPNYILFVSTLEPRKNVAGLVQAYRMLPGDLKKRFGLVLAGGRGWKDDQIRSEIAAARAAGEQIITPGYVADADLPALYFGASLFAYPSFYEGFGIPPLEAMACGVPVVTSNSSSLPEVVGDAAITVAPADSAAITEGMRRVLQDPKLAEELRGRGLKQARKFSWRDSAERLLKIIAELA